MRRKRGLRCLWKERGSAARFWPDLHSNGRSRGEQRAKNAPSSSSTSIPTTPLANLALLSSSSISSLSQLHAYHLPNAPTQSSPSLSLNAGSLPSSTASPAFIKPLNNEGVLGGGAMTTVEKR